MDVYTYSQARQNFSSVLDKAESTGKVLIRRKDGRAYAVTPERTSASPLDVPSIEAEISTREVVTLIRSQRRRTRAQASRPRDGAGYGTRP